MSRQQGQVAENLALNHLQAQGLSLIAQNTHCRFGEIDLIMRQGQTLVFVEVKYRKSSAFGGPLAAVTASKQNKLRLTAQWYLQQHQLSHLPCRFDVVAIADHKIDWIQDAF